MKVCSYAKKKKSWFYVLLISFVSAIYQNSYARIPRDPTAMFKKLRDKHCKKYNCVHIISDEVFSKILKKPSIMQKEMIPHKLFSLGKNKQKTYLKNTKNQKMSFSVPLNIFSQNISKIGPWVNRIN